MSAVPGGVSGAAASPRPFSAAIMSPGGLGSALRRHWLLAVLLTAGLVLRAATQIAYRPALLYIDSIKYLFGAYAGNDPPGYQLALKVFLSVGTLPMVAAVQHILGLCMAVALYLILRRRGVPRWLAALATAPVLLDGYQLQIEQSIMPDTAFEALIVAGLVILLWQPRPRAWMVVGAGLALGASATVRQVGEIFILPAIGYVLIAVPGWRPKLIRAVALCIAFALPILVISFRNYVAIKHFALAPYAANSIYGRAAAAADCSTLTLPSYERSLCPSRSEQARGPDWLDHSTASPIRHVVLPRNMRHYSADSDFSRRVFLQQPLRVGVAVAKDAIKLFAIQRVQDHGDTPISRWQFQRAYPLYPPYITVQGDRLRFVRLTPAGKQKVIATGQRFTGGEPATSAGLARFLRAYQLDGGYTPGPLLLFMVLAGLAGSLGAARRGASSAQRATAMACLLTFLSAAAVLLASDLFEFSWRYQLPALVTLPAAGALGITVVTGYFAARRRQPAGQQIAAGVGQPTSVPGEGARGPQRKDRASAG